MPAEQVSNKKVRTSPTIVDSEKNRTKVTILPRFVEENSVEKMNDVGGKIKRQRGRLHSGKGPPLSKTEGVDKKSKDKIGSKWNKEPFELSEKPGSEPPTERKKAAELPPNEGSQTGILQVASNEVARDDRNDGNVTKNAADAFQSFSCDNIIKHFTVVIYMYLP